jgi:hypothetical protein
MAHRAIFNTLSKIPPRNRRQAGGWGIQSRVTCECPSELPESLGVVDPGNRSSSCPYEGVGIMRSLALKAAYEGLRQDFPPGREREHYDCRLLIWIDTRRFRVNPGLR